MKKSFPIQFLQSGGAVRATSSPETVDPMDVTRYAWGRRMFDPNAPSIQNPDGTVSTHLMADAERDGTYYAFPTIVQLEDGTLHKFTDPKEALSWNIARGEAVPFGTQEDASRFARNYKQGTPLEQNTRGYQDGGEVDQQRLDRRKRAMELQRLAPQFMPGVPLGMRPKKKKDPQNPFAPQPQQGMQRGGKVKARGTDTVPIMATPGEFVLNRGAVAAAGKPFLNYLNQIGKQSPAMMQGGGPIGKERKETFPVQYRQTGGDVGQKPALLQSGTLQNAGLAGYRNWPTIIKKIPYGRLLEGGLAGGTWIGDQLKQAGANKGSGGGGGTGGTNWGSVFTDPSWINPPNIPISNQGVPVPGGGDNIPVLPPVVVQNPDTRPGEAAWNQRWAANEARAPLLSTAISGGGSGSALSGIGQYFEGATAPSALSGYGALFGGGGGGGMGPPSVMRYLQGGGEVQQPITPEDLGVAKYLYVDPRAPRLYNPLEAAQDAEADQRERDLILQMQAERGYQSGGMVRRAGVSPFAPARAAVSTASPLTGILRGVSNALTQNRLRQQHFAHLASRNFNPNFQPQRKGSPRSRRASPFNPTQR